MADLHAHALYARRWHLPRLAATAILCTALWIATPLRLFDVPARDGVQGALWPMVPTLFAAIVPSVLGTAAEVPERTAPRPIRLRAVTTGLVLLLALALASCGATINAPIAYRNTALLVGLAFAGAWLLPAGAAWAPCILTPIIMWLVGTRPQGRVENWAILLLPGHVPYAALASVTIMALAIAGYIFQGTRA